MSHLHYKTDRPGLNEQLQHVLRWHGDVSALGITRFGEMAWRLTDLLEHCHVNNPADEPPMLSALELAGIESLIAKLHEVDPPFHHWEEPRDELLRILRLPINHHSMTIT